MGGRRAFAVLLMAGLAGCLEEAQRCASGRICPVGSTCDDVNDVCVSGGDTCGDLRVTGSEDCEPRLALTSDCTALGYYEPDGLACRDDCRFDVTGCAGECGDGARNGPEPCEGLDLGGVDCEDFGYYQPAGIVCNPASCTFDLSACTGRCGDLVVDISEGEACDGPAPPGTCVDYGFDAGALRCSPFCTPGFASCGRFGWRSELTGAIVVSNHDVWASSLDDVYLVGTMGTIVHGHSGAWATESSGSRLEGVFGFGDDVFAVGAGGTILRRDPATSTWNPMTIAASDDFYDLWGPAADDLWTVGEAIAHFDGAGWVRQAVPGGGGLLRGVHGSAADDLWAVGDGGTIVRGDGAGWTRVTSPTALTLQDVWVAGPGEAWAVGAQILRWDGSDWSVVADVPGGETLHAVWGAGRDDVTAAGPGGLTAHWDGVTWSFETVPVATINGLFGIDGVLIGALGPGVAFREATTWTESTAAAPAVDRAWMAAPDDVWAIGLDGSLQHWDGASWTAQPIAGDFRAVWGAAADDVWAVGSAGALWHFDGADWTPRSDAAGHSLSAVWGSGPDDVWAFGTGGTFFRWNGTTWTPEVIGGSTTFTRVWGSAPDDIWIIGGFGVIRHFDGAGWTAPENPLAYEPFVGLWGSARDDVWALTGSGLIFHFDGTAWSEALSLQTTTSALWGSAPDDILAVGDLGVAQHFDGTSWAPVRPQVDFFPMVIWGDRAELVVAGDRASVPVHTRLTRHRRWACRPREVACGDAIDDDCDDRVDADDPDCLGGVVIAEVHGGAEDFVELRNRTGAAASLAGLTLEWGGCSAGSHPLDRRAVVRDGEPYRVIRDRTPGTREQWSGGLCDAPDAGGWVMLCAGACDRVACTNVLDFVEKTGTTAPAGVPPCAGLDPAPVSVGGATAAQSLHRIGFTQFGPKGAAADWAVAPMTRD
jgi:hypothetical protein